MRFYLMILFSIVSVGVNAQWTIINGKQRFVKGLGLPVSDTLPGIANDSSQIILRPNDSSIWYKYKTNWRSLNAPTVTAANGLTKDSTVFRLGGSLNQNTNINLNTRRLSFIGGSDTTRFFSNGRVSIGGTPSDSSFNFRVNGTVRITGNTTYNGNLLPSATTGSLYAAGFTTGANTYDPARLQVYSNRGASPMQYLELGSGEINHRLDAQIFFNKAFGYALHSFGVKGIHSSAPGAANTYSYVKVFPTIRIGSATGTDTAFIRGFDFIPTLDSFNNVRFIPFTNTVGSNMLNTQWGNTRIGYPLGLLTSQNTTAYDTTYKLDVNGTGRFMNYLYLDSGRILYGPEGSDKPLVIRKRWGGGTAPGIDIGFNTFNPGSDLNRSLKYVIGDGNTVRGPMSDQVEIFGKGNFVDSSYRCLVLGRNNIVSGTLGSFRGDHIVIGEGNTSNSYSGNKTTSIVIGRDNNTNGYYGGGLFGNGLKYYENQQLAFGLNLDNGFGINSSAIKNVYFGNGVKNELNNRAEVNFGHGPDVTINPSWANDVDSINRNGGSLTIAGGRGTGAGTPGTVRFSTWNATTSGSTLHPTLTERARISPAGNLLVGTATDDTSSIVNIVSTTKGFLQPRMTNTQRDGITTPATGLQIFSTTDSANYVYRGTGGGWQKIANEISGSANLDFGNTSSQNSSDLTITVTGASDGDVVSLGVPNASVNANSCFTAWVSAADTVTVRFNNYSGGSIDPASGTFKIKVFK